MRITASLVANITGGTLVGNDVEASGLSFDSRAIKPGVAFVAIVAERDGNDFVDSAASKGAAFAIVSRGRSSAALPCIEVDDTTAALALLGRALREQLRAQSLRHVIGITGSAGKTTTKNFVRAVLQAGFSSVYASEASLNNDIGVPVTIADAPNDVEALVIEMGMRGFHEIDRLCGIAAPNIGIVTNVGDAHGDRVGGPDGIAIAKGELIEALPADGVAVLNADDERVNAMASRTAARVLTFGRSINADVRYEITETDEDGRCTADFFFKDQRASATPMLPGEHMVINAAAAIAAGLACGMTLLSAVKGIGREELETGRMCWLEAVNGLRILDDSYNANEHSMLAALQVIADLPVKTRFAVLGAMAEIFDSEAAHRRVADFAQANKITVIGLETDLYGTPAMSVEEALKELAFHHPHVVLVKGSRSAKTERIVHELI
jgi:UDP-N-acetylmuramoyl-tripeptide--D-alanyl-D-alanine ligase